MDTYRLKRLASGWIAHLAIVFASFFVLAATDVANVHAQTIYSFSLSQTGSQEAITVSWSQSGADGLEIYRDGTRVKSFTGSIPSSWSDSGVSYGNTYEYYLVAQGGVGVDVSDTKSFTLTDDGGGGDNGGGGDDDGGGSGDGLTPDVPTDFSGTGLDNAVKLTWDSSSPDVTEFRIEGKYCGDFLYDDIEITVGGDARSYTDTGLGSEVCRSYSIQAFDVEGKRSSFAFVDDVITNDTQPPASPSNLSASGADNQISLSWSASSSSDIDYYEVYTSNSSFSGTSGNKLGNTSGTSFSHTGLGSEDRQYYRVFAVDDAGNRSGQSNQVNAKTNDTVAPSAPGISLSSGSKSIAVSLSRPDGDVNRYDIYRSTSSGSNGSVVKTLNTTAGNPSWTDGSVSEDTRYYYRAKARDDAGNYSGFSGQKSAVPTDTWNPAAPTNLNASASGTSISLSWSASGSSDVTRYDVYASNNSFSGTSATKIGNTSSIGFTESGLSSEEQRYYRVVAVDDAGNSSGTSNLADARTADVQAPSAPGISLTQRARAIEVELGKPSADTESYTIYRSTSSGTTGSAVKTITSTNSSPEWTDNSVSEDTRYYYSARATDDAGNTSSLSNQVNEVPGDTWSPAAPASVTASGADNAITVSWDASVSGDVAEYEVYGATSSFTGTNASLLETTSSTSVTQNGLDSEQTVYYRIVAVDDDRNTSDVSNIASATTNDTRAPSPISTLTATAQERAVKLTWSKPSSDAVSYEVYRSASSTDPGSVITTVTSTGSSLEYVDSDVNEDKNEDKCTTSCRRPTTPAIKARSPIR